MPEPPDGSIVGFGWPVEVVVVRDDNASEEARCPDGDHWFAADGEAFVEDPLGWNALLRGHSHRGQPYLLVRQEIRPTDPGAHP